MWLIVCFVTFSFSGMTIYRPYWHDWPSRLFFHYLFLFSDASRCYVLFHFSLFFILFIYLFFFMEIKIEFREIKDIFPKQFQDFYLS